MIKKEELLNYHGISPCPSDIDSYWNETVNEIKTIDPKTELHKVWELPNTECFEMFYTGIGGARIHARLALPKNCAKPAPAIVMFHGYHAKFADWTRLLNFAGQGFCVAAMDCRGQAGVSEDNSVNAGTTVEGHIIRGMFDDSPKKLLYRSIYADAAQLAGILLNMNEVDKNRVYALGGSQGGALTLACASLEPRIKKAFAYCPFLCDFKKAYELEAIAFDEIQKYFIRTDPRHETEDEIFERLAYIDIQNLVHRIQAEVKMATGLLDTSCPPLTQFAMYNKIPTKKDCIIYPDYGHAEYPEIFDIALRWFIEE